MNYFLLKYWYLLLDRLFLSNFDDLDHFTQDMAIYIKDANSKLFQGGYKLNSNLIGRKADILIVTSNKPLENVFISIKCYITTVELYITSIYMFYLYISFTITYQSIYL